MQSWIFQYLNKNLDWNTYFPSFLQIRTPFNYLLMNLVLAETLIAVIGLPIDFLASYYYGWKMGKSLCVLTGFILSTSGKFSFVLVFSILVDHIKSRGHAFLSGSRACDLCLTEKLVISTSQST